MQVFIGHGATVVSLSESNVRNLVRRFDARAEGVTPAITRLVESGTILTIVVEPDEVHYAIRPDAIKAYGL